MSKSPIITSMADEISDLKIALSLSRAKAEAGLIGAALTYFACFSNASQRATGNLRGDYVTLQNEWMTRLEDAANRVVQERIDAAERQYPNK